MQVIFKETIDEAYHDIKESDLMRYKKIILILAILFIALPNTTIARTVASDGELSATVGDSFNCSSIVTLRVYAPSKFYYEGEMIQFHKLVTTARDILEKECPSLGQIQVYGDMNRFEVYRGLLGKLMQGWVMTGSVDHEYLKKIAVSQSNTTQPAKQASAPKPVTPSKIQDISYDRNGDMIFYQAPGVIVKGPFKNEVKNWCEEASHLEPVPNQQTINVELDEENLTSDIMDLESIFYPGIESFLASHVIPKMTKTCQRPPDNFLMIVSFKGREFSVRDHFLFVVRDGMPVKRDFWFNKPFKSVKKGSGSFGYKSVEVKPTSARLDYIQKMSMSQEDMQKLRGPVLYKDNKIEIYAHDFLTTSSIWQRWRKLDLVFNVDPFKSDLLFTPDYMASVLLPIVKKYHPSFDCSENINVFQFQSGSTDYWAEVRYRFKDHDHECTTAKSVVAELSGRSKAARETIKGREDMRWGGCEKDGPFCNMSGGKYLNAIYRGDIKTIEQIDREVMRDMPRCSSQKCSILQFVADSYMYYFQKECFQALGAKAVSKKFSVSTDVYQDDTFSGLPAQWVGGATISATYQVNPEFEALMLRIGNATGDNARSAVGVELGDDFGVLLNGVRQLQKQTGCKSPEIDQFEKNLIRLTNQYLNSVPWRRKNEGYTKISE